MVKRNAEAAEAKRERKKKQAEAQAKNDVQLQGLYQQRRERRAAQERNDSLLPKKGPTRFQHAKSRLLESAEDTAKNDARLALRARETPIIPTEVDRTPIAPQVLQAMAESVLTPPARVRRRIQPTLVQGPPTIAEPRAMVPTVAQQRARAAKWFQETYNKQRGQQATMEPPANDYTQAELEQMLLPTPSPSPPQSPSKQKKKDGETWQLVFYSVSKK